MRRSSAERYLAALEREIAAAPGFAAETLFLGGGTPNAYPPETVAALVRALAARFALAPGAEATIELNPDRGLWTAAGFAAWRAAGITRASFGVQSFVPEEIATLGRRHEPADVAEAVAAARDAGIGDVSLDLIFGVPGQSEASLRRSLDATLRLEPDHVSTYGLTIEPGTPYAAWHARRPGDFASEDLEADLFAVAIDALEAAGYEQYEISNFARPGHRSRHNANYWRNGEYLGLGVGAASYLAGERRTHARSLDAYCAALEAGTAVPGERERLAGDARVGEATMLALRTAEGVDVAVFAERYGVDFHAHYASVLAELRATETLDVTPGRIALTRRGRFLANDVCAAFVATAS